MKVKKLLANNGEKCGCLMKNMIPTNSVPKVEPDRHAQIHQQ